jgi:hypothetical protein
MLGLGGFLSVCMSFIDVFIALWKGHRLDMSYQIYLNHKQVIYIEIMILWHDEWPTLSSLSFAGSWCTRN